MNESDAQPTFSLSTACTLLPAYFMLTMHSVIASGSLPPNFPCNPRNLPLDPPWFKYYEVCLFTINTKKYISNAAWCTSKAKWFGEFDLSWHFGDDDLSWHLGDGDGRCGLVFCFPHWIRQRFSWYQQMRVRQYPKEFQRVWAVIELYHNHQH